MGEGKIALRAMALSQRSALSQTDFVFRSRLIQARVCQFPEYLTARSIALYASIQNEVMTEEIRDHALQQGKKVYYPKLDADNHMELVRLESAWQLKPGRFGIPEPTGDEPLSGVRRGDLLVFVPALAFDVYGNRLGRGTGWYDRLLKKLGKHVTAAGLAYDFQIVDNVPVEPWDRAVAYVFTETRLLDCRETRRRSLALY
jgi:5-formyltetrahydrofolate cyclo-ligase